MLRRVRYFLSDLAHWVSRHRLALGAVFAALLAGGGTAAFLIATGEEDEAGPAPAPEVVVREVPAPEDTEDLGFPEFATKNTTRVAGPDPITDAAAIALAVHPSTGGVPGPAAVSLVDAADWPAGIAAASLTADPIGAPILATEGGEIPALTASALRALGPTGAPETDDQQAFALGAAAHPHGLRTLAVEGDNAAEVAAEVDRLRQRLTGSEPDHLLLTSSDRPQFALPAASWAARSGDPVLFVQRDSVPLATAEALQRHKGTPVYVLGPESAISAEAMDAVRKLAPDALRIGEQDPVASSIAFARFLHGTFGWNINDPGHGFVIASTARPLDAAAAAPLSASGSWGPLLVTDEGSAVPATLRGYLLDVKPGFDDDPTRAVYNHVWLIGDTSALSVAFQAQVDELAEVTQIRSGSGGSIVAPPPPAAAPPNANDHDSSR